MPEPEIRALGDAEAVAREAARVFAERAREAISARGAFRVALSGGTTPEKLYRILAAEPFAGGIDWKHVRLYWGDERCVPPDHPDSNYGAAHRGLISKVPLPAENIFRMRGETDPPAAAMEYAEALRRSFPPAGDWPRFDLILLGVGADGHIASLFPQTEALKERDKWVAAIHVPKLDAWRITLTLPVLNAAAEVLFLAVGEGKREIVREILEGERRDAYPAQRVRPVAGRTIWLLDHQAAAGLKRN